MNDLEASALLRNLSDDYSNNRISFVEYRLQRKIILRKLDEDYNQLYFGDELTESGSEIESNSENIIVQEAEQ